MRFQGNMRLFLSALLLICAVSTEAFGEAKKPVGKDALGSLLGYYHSIVSLKAKFKETKTLKDMRHPLLSEGELTVERPFRVVWQILKPSATRVELSEKKLQITTGEGKDARSETFAIDDKGGGPAAQSLKQLVAWLRLDPDLLLKEYEIFRLSENEYEFVPRDKASSPFVSMEMHLKAKGHLERLKILEKSGDAIVLQFEKPEISRRK